MVSPQNSKRISNFMKHFCADHKIEEIKASKLLFKHKQLLINKLRSVNDCTVLYIVADKQNIVNRKILEDPNLCYNYLFSHLVLESIKDANEDLAFILDNHSTKVKPINSLADYIRIKAYTKWNYRHNLQIQYVNSKSSKLVQAADLMANAIYAKYQYQKNHFYDMLPIVESVKFPRDTFGNDLVIPNEPLTIINLQVE